MHSSGVICLVLGVVLGAERHPKTSTTDEIARIQSGAGRKGELGGSGMARVGCAGASLRAHALLTPRVCVCVTLRWRFIPWLTLIIRRPIPCVPEPGHIILCAAVHALALRSGSHPDYGVLSQGQAIWPELFWRICRLDVDLSIRSGFRS